MSKIGKNILIPKDSTVHLMVERWQLKAKTSLSIDDKIFSSKINY